MSAIHPYKIQTMTREQVDIAIEWAALEGWNPGLNDADCFYAADPNGFFIGLLDGNPIAVISAIKYGESFGFLGFYIVKPEYRGKGYGIQIWNAGLEYLKERNVGLDGVVEQQENYKKSDFKYAYRNIRYQGVGGGHFQKDKGVIELSELPFREINDYDRLFFPDDRSQFLKCWLNQPESIKLGMSVAGKLAGYGVLRVCRTGYKVGPLFADTAELAETLLLTLQAQAKEGAPVYFDAPALNSKAVDLAERHNMKVVFETARMYTGQQPKISMDRLYGVTTFELG